LIRRKRKKRRKSLIYATKLETVIQTPQSRGEGYFVGRRRRIDFNATHYRFN
jgi:hypothetical protein